VQDGIANTPSFAVTLARKKLRWDEPIEPAHIAGPLYYVGTAGLGAYLFATSEGLILLNTGMPGSGPLIEASIRQLGFEPTDIRVLINGHAHMDHAGAFAYFKERTGARLAIMEADCAAIADGGKSDFQYGNAGEAMRFPPVDVDRVLHDGDTVRLGEVVLVAHHTPGHTRGATTWETTLAEGGRTYRVVWPEGGGINPGYRVQGPKSSYPGIAEDYRHTFEVLASLRPDIFLGAHAEWFGYVERRERAEREGIAAWVNAEEYREFVAQQRKKFERALE
jgi:metallo-beta-lactamase class B